MPTTEILQTRTFALERAIPDTDSRTASAVLTTPNRVVVNDPRRGTIEEILVSAGGTWAKNVPLLDAHRRESTDDIRGSVRNIRHAGSKIVGDLHFANDERSTDALEKVRDGHLRDVSVGYAVYEHITIEPKRSQMVAGTLYRAGTLPLRISTKFHIREVSLVLIGADEAAKIGARSATIPVERKDNPPMLNRIDTRAYAAATMSRFGIPVEAREVDHLPRPAAEMTPLAIAREVLQLRGTGGELAGGFLGDRPVSEMSDQEIVARAAEFSEFADVFDQALEAKLVQGYSETNNSLEGWVGIGTGRTFRSEPRLGLAAAGNLKRLPRGGQAKHESADAQQQNPSKLARYARSCFLDEQDFAGDILATHAETIRGLGQAARRLAPDMVFASVHANANLPDGTPLFDGSRSNLGTGALSAANLGTAIAALGNQTIPTGDDENEVPLNITGLFLVVPFELKVAAAGLIRDMKIADPNVDLQLRVDARMGTPGCVDPRTKAQYNGTTTNWLLAAAASSALVFEISYRDGKQEPTCRLRRAAGGGEWGFYFDINLDVGARVAGWRGVYFSSGTV